LKIKFQNCLSTIDDRMVPLMRRTDWKEIAMKHGVQKLSLVGFLLAAGLVLLPATAQAASESAGASATILTPIAITDPVDLSFGVLTATVASTITIDVANGNRSSTVLASLITNGAAASAFPPSRASFTVTGTPDLTFSISATAATVQLVGPAGSTAMAVTLSGVMSSAPTTGAAATASTGTLSSLGVDTLYIGGSLVVPAGNSAGTYTNSNGIGLTVDYN
jgi:hypothetical protein